MEASANYAYTTYGSVDDIRHFRISGPAGGLVHVSALAQAQQVFALAQKNCPTAKLQLVDGSLDGEAIFFLLAEPNPEGVSVWIIKGTVPGSGNGVLEMDDYAGDVWDRGPKDQGFGGKPGELDTNGAYGGIGGENLVYFNAGSGLSEFKWSESPQQAIS